MRFSAPLFLAFVIVLNGAAFAADSEQQRADHIFAAYDKAGSPGCALGVIRDGKLAYSKGYGLASLELGVPISPETVFYIGSVSKQFTAASVVLAAEQGFLSLDDDVRKYIPELPDYGHTITLRQMLHHTSGFRDFLALLYWSGQNAADLHPRSEMLGLVVRQKGLNNTPGSEFIYSNTNYFLLGEVVQRATKKSLAKFAAQNIFRPLGMMHTLFYDDHTLVVPGRAAAYDPASDGKFLVDWSTNYETVGGGGVMSNVDDLLLWDRNFYQNKLGKGTLTRELLTRGTLNNGRQISYALGLGLGEYRGLRIVEHDGQLFGYRAVILRFPEQRFSVACLCNLSSVNVTTLARNVADVYLEKDLKPEATAPSTASQGFPDPAVFAGRYLDSRKHFVYTFTAASGNLMAWGANLQRLGPNQFRDLGTDPITFTGSGASMKATLEIDGDAFFAGSRIADLHPSEKDLAAYVGRYTSAELDTTFTFSLKQGKLVVGSKINPELPLSPVAEDEFESEDLGNVVFQRNAEHRIIGFKLFTVSARGVSFEKND